MKKKIEDITKSLSLCTLYFDDISEIYNILREYKNSVKISTDKYHDISSLDEIKDIKIKSLEFIVNKESEYIYLEFNEKETNFYSNAKTIYTVGIISKIEETLQKIEKSKKLHSFKVPIKMVILVTLWLIINRIILSTLDINEEELERTIILISGIITLLLALINFKILEYKNEFILNKKRIEYSFFQEHKEWIIPLLTMVGGYLLGEFF